MKNSKIAVAQIPINTITSTYDGDVPLTAIKLPISLLVACASVLSFVAVDNSACRRSTAASSSLLAFMAAADSAPASFLAFVVAASSP